MPSAAEVAAEVAAKVPTTEEIAAAVIAALRTRPIAINKPSQSEIDAAKAAGKPAPTGSEAPLAWFVQNIEQDGDNAAAAILVKLDTLIIAVGELAKDLRALAAAVGPTP